MPAGQPPYYNSPEEFEGKVIEYFDQFKPLKEGEEREIQNYEKRPTITGLCLFLGFESRQSYHDYIERSPEFSYALKRARMRIENIYETFLSEKNSATGAIFALKNMGWADKQEIDHTSGGDKIQGPPQINVFNTAPPMASSEDEVNTEQPNV